MNMFINIVAFKIGWLASVVGVVLGMPMLGPAVTLLAIGIHLVRVERPANELFLIVVTGVVGAAADSMMIAAGWLSYPSGMLLPGLSPYWIVAMWMLFATTFNVSFGWLRSRILLATAFGAVSGPLSYYFGAKFGAVSLIDFWPSMIALAVSWGVLIPALLLFARYLDRTFVPVETSSV
jgi:Protein of unknown function (DUF2878)